MIIRCPSCHGSIGVETLLPGECPPSVRCDGCQQIHSLMAAGELGVTTEEQLQRARQYAEFNQIDLPSAYTVLLGLMTPKQARETDAEISGAANKPKARTAVTPPSSARQGTEPTVPFETGFEEAVRGGHLSRQQAMQRGDRRVFATQLARRHGLPMHLAELVADNKLSLHSATQRVRPPIVPLEEQPVNARQKLLMFGFAAVLLIGVVVQVRGQLESNIAQGRAAQTNQSAAIATPQEPENVSRTRGLNPSTQIETNEEGYPVRIVASTPEAILQAYCTHGPQADRFEVLELSNSIPPTSGGRLGILRNFDDFQSPYVIDIRRDRESGRWSTGNGVDPIIPRIAPPSLGEPVRIASDL